MKKSIVAFSTAVTLLSTVFITPASANTYTVKKGDTLAKIAKKYKTTVEQLQKINQLTSTTININQKLAIATTTKAGQESITIDDTKTTTYTIIAGDTLTKIANKHNLTLAELKELNPTVSDTIYVGDTLIVSKTTDSTVIDLPNQPENATKITDTYVVVKGDTLSIIAKKMKTTVTTLKAANNLTSDMILIGQKLKLSINASETNITVAAPIESKSVNISDVITAAKSVIGTPYEWAGASPSGFDCSGFVYYAFKQAGSDISRHSSSTYYQLGKSVSSPQAGDLVFFATGSNTSVINHMGIYLENDEFIHASSSKGVQINSVTSSYYKSKLKGYKRL